MVYMYAGLLVETVYLYIYLCLHVCRYCSCVDMYICKYAHMFRCTHVDMYI